MGLLDPAGRERRAKAVRSLRRRMPEQARKYGDITVAVTKLVDARNSQLYGDNPQIECVELIADIPAGNEAFSAVEKLAPVLETLVDLMSFEMGTPLGLGQMNVIDITPPVSIGDERDWTMFTNAPIDRHARAIDMQAVQGVLLGRCLHPLRSVTPRPQRSCS
jgi:hypothetical protein